MDWVESCKASSLSKSAAFCEIISLGHLSAKMLRVFCQLIRERPSPIILDSLRRCGYNVTHMLLNSARFGVPQRRERVFIVGFKNPDDFSRFTEPPEVKTAVVLRSVVFDESEIPAKYYFSDRAVAGMLAAKPEMNKGRAQDLDKQCGTVGAHLAKVSLNSTDPVLKIDGRYRRFMPREVARIQSFPDSYVLDGVEARQYRALGNAIPPVLAWHVMNAVRRALEPKEAGGVIAPAKEGRGEEWSEHHKLLVAKPTQMLLAVERKKAQLKTKQQAKGFKGKKLVVKHSTKKASSKKKKA